MKLNGVCVFCYLKKLFTNKLQKIDNPLANEDSRVKGAAVPVMGWSSWNTFKNKINEDVIYETAKALRDTGLLHAGYQYRNIDDNWMSGERDENNKLQGDLATFPSGIPSLISKINDLGIKVGLYTSNGTETCEKLPASLYYEKIDALTFARWGAEYFKYDFCNNIPIPKYAPWIYGIDISKDKDSTFYPVSDAELEGLAMFKKSKAVPTGKVVVGLDRSKGAMTYCNISVEEDGEYVLTINVQKQGSFRKYVHIVINDSDEYGIYVPSLKKYNNTARYQTKVFLKKGLNTIKLFNPITSRFVSAKYQYRYMDKCLDEATKQVAKETGKEEKPITFSICEWGFNRPWKWGHTAGNSWRTTMDIMPRWWRIMMIYRRNVKLYKYAKPGHWNDPDMLEVGNGDLTEDENRAHFSTWAMMNSPLILGMDLRKIDRKTLRIVTNIQMVKINQDPLGKQAKRIKKGALDILAKPLSDGKVAVCFFNRRGSAKNCKVKFSTLIKDEYIKLAKADTYYVWDVWESNGQDNNLKSIDTTVDRHSANVFIITPKISAKHEPASKIEA